MSLLYRFSTMFVTQAGELVVIVALCSCCIDVIAAVNAPWARRTPIQVSGLQRDGVRPVDEVACCCSAEAERAPDEHIFFVVPLDKRET